MSQTPTNKPKLIYLTVSANEMLFLKIELLGVVLPLCSLSSVYVRQNVYQVSQSNFHVGVVWGIFLRFLKCYGKKCTSAWEMNEQDQQQREGGKLNLPPDLRSVVSKVDHLNSSLLRCKSVVHDQQGGSTEPEQLLLGVVLQQIRQLSAGIHRF